MMKPTVYLIGDAILDNFYTLANREKDLTKELTDLGFNVNNYAIDDVKVPDLINGIVPNGTFIKARKYPYPIQNDGKIYPLKSLVSSINVNKSFKPLYGGLGMQPIGASPRSDNMVVISFGGNDIHSKIKHALLGSDHFISTVLSEEFKQNVNKIIETSRSCCDKIVLVSIYLPFLGVGSSYGIYSPMTKSVIEKWHKYIYGIGKQYNIPILDLSKTLNIGERSHYGVDDARASNISNKCMADCLSYIYYNYSGYHVYSAPSCDSKNITVE
jgi:hypothetical protein